MTSKDRIDLEDLPTLSETRRDQWGRYKVVPPAGGKPIGYTRVTTVAKTLDEGGGLAPWKATMTAAGIIMRRGLRSSWEALLAAHGDPWYAGQEAKAECRKLVEDCAAVGGANDRKEVGTALHTITALVDLGKTPQHLTVETERDVRAYTDGLAKHNVQIVPGQVELVTVLDSVQVAGTFDRLAIVPGFDLPLIADLKTGANLSYSWQSIAVQMAAYSRGEALYEQGAAPDGSLDVRKPMPAIEQNVGLIMWLNIDGESELELFLVDLNAGWEAFEHSLWTRDWRKLEPQRRLEVPGELEAQLQASLDAQAAKPPKAAKARKPRKHAAKKEKVEDSEPAEVIDAYHGPEVRAWLQHRIDTIGEGYPEARTALMNTWPKDVPTLRASDAHTPAMLDDIEHLLDAIEKLHSVQFSTQRPGAPTTDDVIAKVVEMFPGTTTQPAKDTAQ